MEDAAHLLGELEHFVRDYGAFAVMLVLMIESLGAPVPGETVLIFASVLAGRGEMSLPALLICALVGAVLGDNIGYAIGRSLGRSTISRYGAKIGLSQARFASIESIFRRYGSATVVFARFVSILRQLNGIAAGTLGMSWGRFLPFDALGGALWVTFWVFAASYSAEHVGVLVNLAPHTKIVAGLLATIALILVVGLVLRRYAHGVRRRPGARQGGEDEGSGSDDNRSPESFRD